MSVPVTRHTSSRRFAPYRDSPKRASNSVISCRAGGWQGAAHSHEGAPGQPSRHRRLVRRGGRAGGQRVPVRPRPRGHARQGVHRDPQGGQAAAGDHRRGIRSRIRHRKSGDRDVGHPSGRSGADRRRSHRDRRHGEGSHGSGRGAGARSSDSVSSMGLRGLDGLDKLGDKPSSTLVSMPA